MNRAGLWAAVLSLLPALPAGVIVCTEAQVIAGRASGAAGYDFGFKGVLCSKVSARW
jgi:hypothetical protein